MGNLKSFGTATTPEQKAWEMEVRRKGQLAQAEKRHRKKALNDILDAILAMKCDTSALTDDYITETAQKLAAEKGESITPRQDRKPRRKSDPKDKRSQLIFPTEKAETLKSSKAETESAFYEFITSSLTEKEAETFAALLDKVYSLSKTESRAGFPHFNKFTEKSEEK